MKNRRPAIAGSFKKIQQPLHYSTCITSIARDSVLFIARSIFQPSRKNIRGHCPLASAVLTPTILSSV
jgi:hypothetical protein